MNRFLLIIVALFMLSGANAQDNKLPKVGIGMQFGNPFAAFSIKLSLTPHSVLQGVVGPYAYGYFGRPYVGARYLYRFNLHNIVSDKLIVYPYLFAGAGGRMMHAEVRYDTKPPLYYNFGAGYEMLFAKSFGISGEVGYGYGYGYGNYDFYEGINYKSYFYYGLGLHYYFMRHHSAGSANQATLPMHSAFRDYAVPDEDDTEAQQVPDARPTDKKRTTNPGDDSED